MPVLESIIHQQQARHEILGYTFPTQKMPEK